MLAIINEPLGGRVAAAGLLWSSDEEAHLQNKHTASSGSAGQPDISDALRSDPALSAFTFDGPYSVTDGYDLLDSMCCVDNGRYYETPIDWKGLTRAFAQSPLHQSALYFKRNVLTGCYIPHPLLSRQAFSAFALDWFVFGNAYLERRSNRPGDPLKLKHVPALNTRREATLIPTGLSGSGRMNTSSRRAKSATS